MAYDVIVIGGGHAGCEAALAAARMGARTAMVTLFKTTIGQMSCNPAIGGVGKGQLVKEIDALGGAMALAADCTAIQFRRLNASRGMAVRSSRCQSDRKRYQQYMQAVVEHQDLLDVWEAEALGLLIENGRIKGLVTSRGFLAAPTVVVTTGTFLKGRIHRGREIRAGGRIGEPASVSLADDLERWGFPVVFFKTGTPPRLDGTTIDYSRLEAQHSDDPPHPFSFRTHKIPPDQVLLPCYLTRTTDQTLAIIRENLSLSPMYSGQIQATGVRYCPSIEDKVKKFPHRESHTVFLEPEGLDTNEVYPNGISTGLPQDVQEKFVRTIPGLEKVRITQYGYSIEHGVVPPTELHPWLETKRIEGLFFAGQINGTTGYEEAAAQGIVAGINAVLKVRQETPFVLKRSEAYIGVLIDDLTRKGTDEPYRMFTSRVEHRLLIREDNADERLMEYGHRFGLIDTRTYDAMRRKYDLIRKEIDRFQNSRIHPTDQRGRRLNELLQAMDEKPFQQSVRLSDLLKRPRVSIDMIWGEDGLPLSREIADQVEYCIKYEGFIERQKRDVARFRHLDGIRIPDALDIERIQGLSLEIRQKLKTHRPKTLAEAQQIPGMTPAALGVLMVHIQKLHKGKTREPLPTDTLN